MSKRSEVIAFPVKNRVRDIQRCVDMLETLQGDQANRFWRDECRALAAHLTELGYDDTAMRHEVMEFQNAVQAQLWAQSRPKKPHAAIRTKERLATRQPRLGFIARLVAAP